MASESITVHVTDPVLVVSVTTDKDFYTNRDKVLISVEVTDGSFPIPNATVSVTVTTFTNRTKVFTGTTDAAGKLLINYKFNVRKDGYGEYSVLATATLSGYQNGSDSTNFIVE